MNSNTKKIMLFGVIVVALVGGAIGYYLYNKGPLDVKNSKATRVNAAELYSMYSTDSFQAQKKYTGKVVEVSGEILEMSVNAQQQKVILVKTNADGAHINCTLEGDAMNVEPAQKITIKGIASGIGQGDADLGILGDVYLTRCYIIPTQK